MNLDATTATPYDASYDARHALAQRKGSLRCRSCGSSDLWRVPKRSGIVAAIMRYRGFKPIQCRACGWVCYRHGKREAERLL